MIKLVEDETRDARRLKILPMERNGILKPPEEIAATVHRNTIANVPQMRAIASTFCICTCETKMAESALTNNKTPAGNTKPGFPSVTGELRP
jgi:hypothetical protein